VNQQILELRSRDGHTFEAFAARPDGGPLGGVVVVQEMYGVNDYLKSVCGFYASHGYHAVAPSLYDRYERSLVFDYTKTDHDRAQKLYKNWDFDLALDDLDCARDAVGGKGKVGIVGFCWGGTLAWLAACRRDYACAVAYYGSTTPDFGDEAPRCPVIAHVGDRDNTLPKERIDIFRSAQPDVPVYIYPGAQHGFDNRDRTSRFHECASQEARRRTVELFAQFVGRHG
jgi:carboxymethylenebutenolidase